MTEQRKRISELSRVDWSTQINGDGGTSNDWPTGGWQVIDAGLKLRIANALERIASQNDQARIDLRNAQSTIRRLRSQIRRLKKS